MHEEIFDDKQNLSLKRSNRLIESRNMNTLLQNKVLAFCMSKAEMQGDNPVAEFSVSEMRGFNGLNIKNINKVLRSIETSGINKSFMIRDAKGSGYVFFNLIDTWKYDGNGHVYVKFTQGMKEHMMVITEPYTTAKIAKLFLLQKNSSLRLYELLLTKTYLFEREKTNVIKCTYDLMELKLQLGLVKFLHNEEEKLKKKLGRNPSAKEIFEEFPDLEPYHRWSDFKNCVLEPAREEIASLGDKLDFSKFEYTTLNEGRGGKVMGVNFFIFAKEGEEYKDEEAIEKLSFIKELDDASLTSIYKAAKGDVDEVKRVYDIAKKTPNISNLAGWLISALKKGNYSERVEIKSEGKAKRAFHNYDTSNEVDYDALLEKVNNTSNSDDNATERVRIKNKAIFNLGDIFDRLESFEGSNDEIYDFLEELEEGYIEPSKTEIEDVMVKDCCSLLLEEAFNQSFKLRTIISLCKKHNYDLNSIVSNINSVLNDSTVTDIEKALI